MFVCLNTISRSRVKDLVSRIGTLPGTRAAPRASGDRRGSRSRNSDCERILDPLSPESMHSSTTAQGCWIIKWVAFG